MTAPNLRQLVEKLTGYSSDIYNKDFLLTWDHPEKTIRTLLDLVEALEQMYRAGVDLRVFHSGLAVSNFRDNSTRTRFSFASACNMLGLAVQDIDETKSQIAHGETVRETANMISFLTQVIGIRDDMYIHEGHKYMTEVSEALDDGFKNNVLAQRPGVVNLQCDYDHPTQSLADLQHLIKVYGSLENLRGKKIAMTWAYSPSYGKPLSVPQGIITLMTRFGMNVVLAHPTGYDLLPETLDTAKKHAKESGGSFSQVATMGEAFADADIVYPKSWASFRVMEERTKLLRAGGGQALKDLEKKCLEQNAQHKDWECNRELMNKTKNKKALYMHCLPADITSVSCKEGEVSAEVFEQYRLDTYREAGHKPFVIAAMIMLTRFKNPAEQLAKCLSRAGL